MKYLLFSRNRLKVISSFPWAFPAMLLMRAIRPILNIQICKIYSERIGHFIPDVSEHICREKFRNHRTMNLYYFEEISNIQWEIMARRSNLRIIGSWIRYIDKWNQLIPGGSQHVLKSSLTQSRDTEGLFLRYDASIPFTDEEGNIATNFLKSKGWTVGEPFICILVRDSKFMESYSPFDWSYHSYRNSDINSYLTSMEWLASQGVWVLRMGKLMSCPIATNSKRIIDYAFDSGKSDLLDIWLFANCNGVISTATGLDHLATIYRRPQLYLNALPLGCLHSWSDMIWVPKNLRWQKTQESLTITEYLEHEYYHSHEYKDAGIEILDLSEDEIGASVQEFWLKINGTWQPTAQGLNLQESFWKTLKNWSRFNEMHGTLHIKACVGENWLTKFDKELMT